MLLEVILGLLLLWAMWHACKKPEGLPPGPWGLPLIGSIYRSLLPRQPDVKKLREKYGDIFMVRVGTSLNMYVCRYELCKEICSRAEFLDRPHWHVYNFMSDNGQGTGITGTSGLSWQTSRRFTLRHLRDLGMGKSSIADAISLEAREMIQQFEKAAGGLTDLDYFINVAVTNVIWQMVSGQRYDLTNERMKRLSKTISEFQMKLGISLTLDVFPWLTKIIPSWVQEKLFRKKLRETEDIFTEFLEELCAHHKATLDPDNPRDYIDSYLMEMEACKDEPKSIFTDKALVSLLWDLFIAGSDTVALSLRWFILCMCQYPEVQRKVQREIDDVVSGERQPSWEDKNRMPYTEAVLHEVHRVFIIIPLALHRVATEDTMLGGYKIPKGAILYPATFCSHNEERYWDRPSEFWPERFLNDDNEFVNPRNGFMPFGVGRRSCVGEALARMEMFIFTTSLLQKFTFSPGPDGVCLEPMAVHIVNMSRPQKVKIDFRK